jgi:tRNA (guanine37-N1)-methyltransferase
MRFDLITIFPEFFAGPLDHGIVRRAQQAGIVQIQVQDLREFTKDRHRTVDDRPFGGGEGMVLKPEPLFEAVEKLLGHTVGDAAQKHAPQAGTAILLMSAAGRLFTQETARRYAKLERVLLICGRYEGVDERVAEHLATEEVCVGDYVLSGGELPAATVVDAVTRLLPGAVGNEASTQNESFQEYEGASTAAGRRIGALLDFPHYTRPAEYRGWKVPEVLIGGNHAEVAKWRRERALAKTRRNRPELSPRVFLGHVQDVIHIAGRGLVLVPEYSSWCEVRWQVGDTIEVRSPAGPAIRTIINGVSHLRPFQDSKARNYGISIDETIPWPAAGMEIWLLEWRSASA